MGYCQFPARLDWLLEKENTNQLSTIALDGWYHLSWQFDYVWCNISLSEGADAYGNADSIQNNVSDEADGEFVDDNDCVNINDSSDNNDDESDDNEEDYNNNNDDGSIDYDTVVNDDEDDDKDKAWYKKAPFMIDWVNKFSRTDCVHPGFAISIN